METNLLLVIFIAVLMALITGFFDALVKQVTSGIWDYGYLASMFIYSVFVGVIAGYTGLLDLSMPFEQWWTVLAAVFAQYFVYLTMMHSVLDYIISKIFASQPQGLATPFLKDQTKYQLARK